MNDKMLELVEFCLYVSAASSAMLTVYSWMFKNGKVWTVWKLNMVAGIVTPLGAIMWLHSTRGSSWWQIAVIAIAVSRLMRSVCEILLTMHLADKLTREKVAAEKAGP